MNKKELEEVKIDLSYKPSFSSDDTELSVLMKNKWFKSSNGFILHYRLYVPENYNKNYKYPLVTFFHGAGEVGKDNKKQLQKRFVFLHRILNKENLIKYPCIVIAPQCTKEDGWVNIRGFGINYKMKENPQSRSLEAFMELIDSLKTKYKIDSDRLYLTGLSLGGAATLDTIARNPNVFACGITMCSYIAPIYDVESFKYANLWQFHGIIDEVCPYKRSEEMVGAIKKKGYYAHLTSYPAANHGLCWTWGYENKMLLDYMFSSRRGMVNKYLLNDNFCVDKYERIMPKTNKK